MYILPIDKMVNLWCNMFAGDGKPPRVYRAGGNGRMEVGMTNAELASFLETLAKLVEATAKDQQTRRNYWRCQSPDDMHGQCYSSSAVTGEEKPCQMVDCHVNNGNHLQGV